MVEGVVVNQIVSAQVLNHMEVRPHMVTSLVLVEDVTTYVLHSEDEVGIPIFGPFGDKGHVVAEPTHELSGEVVAEMSNVMLNPAILVVASKYFAAVL